MWMAMDAFAEGAAPDAAQVGEEPARNQSIPSFILPTPPVTFGK